MLGPPLQVVDTFLQAYNVGDALLLVIAFGGAGLLLRRSNKLFSLHIISLGALLMILPTNMLKPGAGSFLGSAPAYKFVGLAMIVVAPVVLTLSRR